MTKQQQVEREEAKARLLQWLKPGDTVYTIARHVSRSGMQREIGLIFPIWHGDKVDFMHPNHTAATVLGWRISKGQDAVIVGGAGMDMGFHLVYSLSHKLFGDGYALKQRWL